MKLKALLIVSAFCALLLAACDEECAGEPPASIHESQIPGRWDMQNRIDILTKDSKIISTDTSDTHLLGYYFNFQDGRLYINSTEGMDTFSYTIPYYGDLRLNNSITLDIRQLDSNTLKLGGFNLKFKNWAPSQSDTMRYTYFNFTR